MLYNRLHWLLIPRREIAVNNGVDERLERSLIDAIRREEAREASSVGVSTGTVVSKVGDELSVPEVEIRGAIWRLVDARQIEFTKGRRLTLSGTRSAA